MKQGFFRHSPMLLAVLLLAACASHAQQRLTATPTNPAKASQPMNTPSSTASQDRESANRLAAMNVRFTADAKPLQDIVRLPQEGVTAIHVYVSDTSRISDYGFGWTAQQWIDDLRLSYTQNNPTGWRGQSGNQGWFVVTPDKRAEVFRHVQQLPALADREGWMINGNPSLLVEIRYAGREPLYIMTYKPYPGLDYLSGSIEGLTEDMCQSRCPDNSHISFRLKEIRELLRLLDDSQTLFED